MSNKNMLNKSIPIENRFRQKQEKDKYGDELTFAFVDGWFIYARDKDGDLYSVGTET